ncbi:MAG: hypothetical protein HZA46_16600 [Planctomycetales bacterium]|nr:hypothetical protein [Planctomycetales bacterium]
MKRCLLAWLAVYVAWSILDGLGHGLAFQSLYADRPGVWRPQTEMKIGVIYLGVLVASGSFVGVYSRFVGNKSVKTGVLYGLIFGIGAGASMAAGGYAVHPIQGELAVGWFLLTVIEATVGGWLVGLIAKQCCATSEPKPTP